MTRIEAPRRSHARFNMSASSAAARSTRINPRWLAALGRRLFQAHQRPLRPSMRRRSARLAGAADARLFREADRLFRCGGEEFVVILEPTAEEYVPGNSGALSAAVVEAHDFPQVGSVTISMGYTRVAAGDDGAAAFRRADEALYAAKRQGRNRVICYEELAGGDVFPATTAVEARRAARIDRRSGGARLSALLRIPSAASRAPGRQARR